MRTDLESEALIALAAAAQRVSVSEFVLRAAVGEADRVLGRADTTPVPADQFDAMIASLDEPDPSPGLSEIASRPRRYRQA